MLTNSTQSDYQAIKDHLLSLCGVVYEWRDANGVKHLLHPKDVCVCEKNGVNTAEAEEPA